MSSHHLHSHSHTHHQKINYEKLNRAFIIGIILNFGFLVIEALFGYWHNSLSLLSDAGHNLSDVASLILSLIAFKLIRKKATAEYTYGFRRATILASLLNAILLIFAVGLIIYEAVERFFHPKPLEGGTVAIIAFVGIFINGITAWMFMKDQKIDLNIKGAYLHMLADALVSVGVALGGIIIIFTDWFWIDTVLSIIIGIVILLGTWGLLTRSLKLSLDGVPENIKTKEIRDKLLTINGIVNVEHIHIWALSTTENALTAHIECVENISLSETETIKKEVRHQLDHLQIQHVTLELYFGKKDFQDEI